MVVLDGRLSADFGVTTLGSNFTTVAPQELPNSGESGYPKVRNGVAARSTTHTATLHCCQRLLSPMILSETWFLYKKTSYKKMN